MQPDFRVMRASSGGTASQPIRAGDETLLALEVKQYGKASKANFVDAMNDYAAACRNAAVVLVNYGEAAASFLDDVEPRHRSRVNLIGGFRPYPDAEESIEREKTHSSSNPLYWWLSPRPPLRVLLRL